MKSFPPSHPWDVTPPEAVAIQNRLRPFVVLAWDHPPVSRVAGLDCSYARRADHGYAVATVLDWPQLDEIEVAWAVGAISFLPISPAF